MPAKDIDDNVIGKTMKIQYTLLSLPCLLFSSCDSDSSNPVPNFEPVSVIGNEVNFSGIQTAISSAGESFIDLELQLQEQLNFGVQLRSEGVRTVISSTTNIPDENIDIPLPGEALSFLEFFEYAYIFDPTQNLGTITIFDGAAPGVDLVRRIRFQTPLSGTWTDTANGLSVDNLDTILTGSGTFTIL